MLVQEEQENEREKLKKLFERCKLKETPYLVSLYVCASSLLWNQTEKGKSLIEPLDTRYAPYVSFSFRTKQEGKRERIQYT